MDIRKTSNSGKGKHKATASIEPSKILSIYEAVLPLFYDKTNESDIAPAINGKLRKIIQYDFLHYVMEGEGAQKRLHTQMTVWKGFGQAERELNILPVPKIDSDSDGVFEEDVRRNYERAIELRLDLHPEPKDFHYYRIEEKSYPHIVIGFFRAKDSQKHNGFTPEEKRLFNRLGPHLFRLYRAALTHLQHSEAFRYFDSYSRIGSQIVEKYDLSDAEAKLLPDILFGYSNDEIAERHFVSLATVKMHVNHILKKTGTKNRVDFITKFFTSPENVEL